MQMRFSHLVWAVMVVATLYVTYQVKYRVQNIEEDIATTQRAIAAERDSIHVLEAEWSYLNRPDRLSRLSAEYHGLQRVGVSQIVSVDTLPMAPVRTAPIDASATVVTPAAPPVPEATHVQASPSAPSGEVLPTVWSAVEGDANQ
ncbi:MAG: hypothetical protein IT567_05555 [Alphaproteobacteria bacterium]|nr:hypothetical protein [Alphaproteobacteria bacterium]